MTKRLAAIHLKIVILLLAGAFCVAPAAAQDVPVTLPGTRLAAREIFDRIERQTPYRFAYSSRVFDDSRIIDLPAARLPLKTILERVADLPGITYLVREEIIVIGPVRELAAEKEEPEKETPPETDEEPETDDLYQATDIRSLNALPLRRKPLPAVEKDTVRGVRVVVKPESPDSLQMLIDARPPTSHEVPVKAYLVYKGQPKIAIKTNLVHWVVTASPNLSVDIGLGRRTSLELYGANNRWKKSESLEQNRRLTHWMVRPEFRYWLCERMNGHFFGANVSFWKYNISGHKILSLFKKDSRYKGNAFGIGVTYGYHMAIIPRLGLEFSVGVGVSKLKYDIFGQPGSALPTDKASTIYFGPTRADIGLVFIIK